MDSLKKQGSSNTILCVSVLRETYDKLDVMPYVQTYVGAAYPCDIIRQRRQGASNYHAAPGKCPQNKADF